MQGMALVDNYFHIILKLSAPLSFAAKIKIINYHCAKIVSSRNRTSNFIASLYNF